jgi:hypothetical protein
MLRVQVQYFERSFTIPMNCSLFQETFSYTEDDYLFEMELSSTKTKFDESLQIEWDSKMEKGIFWYSLNFIPQRIISNKFFLQVGLCVLTAEMN